MDRRLNQPKERAETIVQFALVAPFLALILFGILELGRVVDAWVIVHNAAREGARVGVVTAPDSAVSSAARTAAQNYLASGLVSRTDIVSRTVEPPTVTAQLVQVRASAQVRLYTPLFSSLLNGGSVPVRAAATMRRQ